MRAGAACLAVALAGLVLVVWQSAVSREAPLPALAAGGRRGSIDMALAPPRDLDELRARIMRVLLREQVPGAGIALVDGDRILWAGGVGYADRERGVPVTADTLFRVGSITKTFVAMALVQLAERGRLDLGARVRDLAPEIAIGNRWEREQPITVAHLLEHTAGFDDMRPNELFAPSGAEAIPLRDVLARNPGSRDARWRPGSRFSYANPGYTVAGYLIEKVTGRAYEDVLRRELLEPLGMAGAALRWTPEVDARLARGYHTGAAPVPYHAIYHRPAGNLMASPRDLAALVQLALARGRAGGRAVISPAGLARMERSETAWLDTGESRYGLGIYGDASQRALVRGHDGGITGFLSSYGYLPDHGTGFVMLLNSTRSGRAVMEIRQLLVEYLLTGVRVPPPPRAEVPEAALRRWAGTYHGAAPRNQLYAIFDRVQPGLELFVERGRLHVRTVPARGAPLELIPLGGDRFRVASASAGHVQLGRDRDGRRILVADNMYFAEEPRARTLLFAVAPRICVWLLASGLLFGLLAFRRQVGPAPSIAWPLATVLAFFAVPWLFVTAAGAGVFGERNAYTIAICAATLVFAFGSAASAVQALAWLPRPGALLGKLHRLAFAVAACSLTAFLAAYDLIGLRLWRY